MIIAKIGTFPLRTPFKPGTQAAASAWGDKGTRRPQEGYTMISQ